jgi:hypothetical protein
MSNEYPSEEELQKIEVWDHKDPLGLVEFIKDIWHWEDYAVSRETKDGVTYLQLDTGGWSGNEDIVSALEKNMFWSLWWQRSERSGHYWFEIRDLKTYLGDGVYVEIDNDAIILTTDNGWIDDPRTRNRIILESRVYNALIESVNRRTRARK